MGKVTAVIGGNGAGKSTLFKLLLRLYEPKSGEIRFGGDGIGKYSLTDWRDRFAVVSQRNPLIGGTVRENIAYGLDREVSDEELAETARRANFSGGQGQCIKRINNAEFVAKTQRRAAGGDMLRLPACEERICCGEVRGAVHPAP